MKRLAAKALGPGALEGAASEVEISLVSNNPERLRQTKGARHITVDAREKETLEIKLTMLVHSGKGKPSYLFFCASVAPALPVLF